VISPKWRKPASSMLSMRRENLEPGDEVEIQLQPRGGRAPRAAQIVVVGEGR